MNYTVTQLYYRDALLQDLPVTAVKPTVRREGKPKSI